jgi:UDP-N-acetyl-D-glucosamine dehydrogenase
VHEDGSALESVDIACGRLKDVDCVVILTAHPDIDYQQVVRDAPLVVDTRNALHGCDAPHVIRL